LYEPESKKEIALRVRRLLDDADAAGRFPTPIADIVATRRLQLASPREWPFGNANIVKAPGALRSRITRIAPRIQAVLDRTTREIHVHPSSTENQKRFRVLHEVGHDLCEWQTDSLCIDVDDSLSDGTQILFEREANYAAASLLFQAPVFRQLARDLPISAESICTLASKFGGSFSAAFRFFVESEKRAVCGIVLPLSPRPHSQIEGHFVFDIESAFESPACSSLHLGLPREVGALSTTEFTVLLDLYGCLRKYGGSARQEFELTDSDSRPHVAQAELFETRHNLFLLMHAFRPIKRRHRLIA
jgi:hypothetical protein